MKTTLNLRDDLVRRAKARAALQGKALARYIEEGIEQRLLKEESQSISLVAWAQSLPDISAAAAREIDGMFSAANFRQIDPEMWDDKPSCP